jgi:ABC-type glutathione transport system ATPase component
VLRRRQRTQADPAGMDRDGITPAEALQGRAAANGGEASPILATEDVSVEFPVRRGVSRVIHQVTLDLRKGEVLGIVGETGSGKSMTLRAIMNLIPPPGRLVSGSVYVQGHDLRRLSKRGWRQLRGAVVGFVPQAPWGGSGPDEHGGASIP